MVDDKEEEEEEEVETIEGKWDDEEEEDTGGNEMKEDERSVSLATMKKHLQVDHVDDVLVIVIHTWFLSCIVTTAC